MISTSGVSSAYREACKQPQISDKCCHCVALRKRATSSQSSVNSTARMSSFHRRLRESLVEGWERYYVAFLASWHTLRARMTVSSWKKLLAIGKVRSQVSHE